MRSPIRALASIAALALFAAPSLGQTCLTTLFADNNGGSAGGAVYFDLTVTNAVRITSFETNYDVSVGSPVGLDVYTNSTVATFSGNETDPNWTQIGTGTGTSAGGGNPSIITLASPIVLTPGVYPMALVSIGDGHRYTTLPAPQTYSDANLQIDIGSASNSPFSGTIFFPRGWNGSVCYTPATGLFPSFTANPTSGASPLTVQFTDTTFTSDPGGVLSWAWDFQNDGTIDSNSQNPSFTYATCGTYSVSLTVTDATHGQATETKTDLIVVDPQLQVQADFTANPVGGLVPHTVNFTDTSTGSPTTWAWDFDNDGTIDSNTQNPQHTYTTAGQFTVALTVSNPCNSDTETKTNYITVLGSGTNVVPDALNYQWNEYRGLQRVNVATGAIFPTVGTASNFGATDPGRPLFRGNETGFGANAYGFDNDVNTGGPVNVSTSITIMFWMRRDPASTTTNPFGYAFGDGTFRAFAAGAAGDGITFRGTSIGNVDSGFDVTMTPGIWQHVALVVDNAAGTAEWYDNGLPGGNQTTFTPGTFSYSGTSNFWVGSNGGSSEFTDNYDMDDFRFYTSALSPNDILASSFTEIASSSPYDTSCDGFGGTNGPQIGATGRPVIGDPAYAVELTGAVPSAPAGLGLAIETHLNGLLPLPLGGNCFLSINPLLVIPTVTDPAGDATVLAPIPNDPVLAGGHIYSQFAVLAGANIQFSNALDTNVQPD